MNEEYKVVELGNNTKWFVASEIVYNNETYQYMVEINDSEDEFLDNYQVVKTYINNGEEYFELITNQDLLKEIVPLLMPEAKEYIEHPEKLQELINEN